MMETDRQILIADIDERLLTELEILFENKGYKTMVAWGGQEALEQIRSGKFDFVLLSDYLPDVSSSELWQALGRLRSRPAVALMQSGEPGPEISHEYLGLGGHCILRKESPGSIVESVHGCLSTGNHYDLNL